MTVFNGKAAGRVLAAIIVAGMAVFLAALTAMAADSPAAKSPAPPNAAQMDEQTKQMMAMIEKIAAPGPQHAQLMKLAGQWKASIKAWMGPGDPTLSQGTSTRKVILGGRFLMDDYKAVFMNKPFEGFGLTGYDSQQKKYVGVWADTMGTMMLTFEGNMDASGKVLTMTSEFTDPASGEKSAMRTVSTFVDDNTEKFEIFGSQGGQEAKQMEITYTRAK